MRERRTAYEIRLARAARRDSAAILKWSRNEFGEAAALRYAALMAQALRDIGDDPERPGLKARPEIMIKGARMCHLEFSRSRVLGPSVQTSRHFTLYRLRQERVIEVGRILHDARDLARHLPKEYRRMEPGDE